MNEDERWIYLDGPEPERIRPLLDALRDLPPTTPEDRERMASAFFKRLDATLAPVTMGPQAAPNPGALVRAPVTMGPQAAPNPGALVRAPESPGVEAEIPARLGVVEEEPRDTMDAIAPPALVTPPEKTAPAPEGLTGTAMALDLPAAVWRELGKLPFKPATPGVAGQGTVKTMQVPVMRGLGDTVPVGDDSIMKAVAALPFAGSTVGASIVPFPRLKLEEYTSLCAELAVRPDRAAEILLRYQVPSQAAHTALDEHWQTYFADQPETRAAFEKSLAQFTAWLSAWRR